MQDYLPYLRKRVLEDRCSDAARLFQGLRDHGYRGSARTVRRSIEPLRAELATHELASVPLLVGKTPIAERTRQRHAEIHGLLAQGYNQTADIPHDNLGVLTTWPTAGSE